jgi:phage/plasmid-like protein (TIGR03299 family)
MDATPTAGGPVILSQNHNLNSINWVGGVTDPGEMIGCGRYQQLRRLTGEGDEAYQNRLIALLPTLPPGDREQIETAMRAAAIRRAGFQTENGIVPVFTVGDNWHRVGTSIAEATDSAHAERLSGLNFKVGKIPYQYPHPHTGAMITSARKFAIARLDNGEELGDVGTKYMPFQNHDAFELCDGILHRYGAKYSAAGSLFGGRRIFIQVDLPRQAFKVGARDEVKAHALFTNPHDGSGVGELFATSNRTTCANTLRINRSESAAKGMKLRHTGDLKARIAEAQEALDLTVTYFEDFAEKSQTLGRTACPNIKHYCNDVLDAVLEVTAADALKGADLLAAALQVTEAERLLAAKSFERKIERRGELLADMLERYESERCGLNGQRGTAWAALNAVTESADHGPLGGRFVGSDTAKASRRFESILTGDADDVKQIAFDKALALAN